MEHRVWSKVDTRQVRRQMLFVPGDAPPALTAGCDTSFACRQGTPCHWTLVIGAAFHNTDVSVIKNVQAGRGVGPPGNVVGSPTFGKITRTRLPTAEAGSSRQIQFAARVSL